jgi:DNA polymerase-3 subunit gamma/tau
MLLYDDINRKGFEGDLVVEGLQNSSEPACKDELAAALLEVVDSFKPKYYSTAKKVDAAYLVSALNILNEVQINYRQARNKRLHVELALIKLCYLQQALQLVSGDNGPVKKKLIESSIAFRTSPIRAVKKTSTGQASGKQNTFQHGNLPQTAEEESISPTIIPEREIARSKIDHPI